VTNWQHKGPILRGGNVFSLASPSDHRSGELVMVGTAVGLHRSTDGGRGWRLVGDGVAGFPVTCVTFAPEYPKEPAIFVGGAPGAVIFSPDGGDSWDSRPLDFPDVTVNVLAVSPSFSEDGVVLAGTLEDGVYRSTTRGRHWKAASFGLRDLAIWDLAISPAWDVDGTAFAVAGDRLYRTTNAARAWKERGQGLEGLAPQTVGISPCFALDDTLFLGTEGHGVWRSLDGGGSWQPTQHTEGAIVNCIAFSGMYEEDHALYAGTARHGVLLSRDGGATWERVGGPELPVLALAEVISGGKRFLLASVQNQGVLRLDLGPAGREPAQREAAWEWNGEGLAAHLLTKIAAPADPSATSVLFAAGEPGLLLRSDDAGEDWRRLGADVFRGVGVGCLAVSPAFTGDGLVLVGGNGTILRSSDGGTSWEIAAAEEVSSDIGAIAFSPAFPEDQVVWACTTSRQLLRSLDRGRTWTALEMPFAGQQIVSLALVPGSVGDHTMLVSTSAAVRRGTVFRLWRSTNDGQRWNQVWEQTRVAPWSVLAVPEGDVSPREPSDQVFIAAGNELFCPLAGKSDAWVARRLPDDLAQILSLAVVGGTANRRAVIAGTSRGVFVSRDDGQNWQQPNGGPDRQPIVALAPSPDFAVDRIVWVLAAGGDLWQFIDSE
jgi:photosystem II stability/assembly factor-like uncharacterized protein